MAKTNSNWYSTAESGTATGTGTVAATALTPTDSELAKQLYVCGTSSHTAVFVGKRKIT